MSKNSSKAEAVQMLTAPTALTTRLLHKAGKDVDDMDAVPPAKHDLWARIRCVWSDTWAIELMAIAVCLVCASAICIVLGVFDNKPLPSMPSGLTMNTVIAIFSTVTKSSLLLVVSSCISQLKWRWYRQGRKLNQIQLFDDASRGPLGALQMLFEHRIYSVACIGAVILVLALTFEPFVQQSLAYKNNLSLQPMDTALVNQSRVFFPDILDDMVTKMPVPVYGAGYAGLWSGSPPITLQCPNPYSDCSWETFPSLDMCHSCGKADPPPSIDCDVNAEYERLWDEYLNSNITAGLLTSNFSCNLTFGRYDIQQIDISASIANTSDVRVTSFYLELPVYAMFSLGYERLNNYQGTFYVLPRDDSVQGLKDPLFAFQILTFNVTNNRLAIVDADECAVGFCLRDYTMSVKNNTPHVDVSNVRYGASFTPPQNMSDKFDGGGTIGYCWAAGGENFVANTSADWSSCNDQGVVNCTDTDADHLSFCAYTDLSSFQEVWRGSITNSFWSGLNLGLNAETCHGDVSGTLVSCDAGSQLSLPSFPPMDYFLQVNHAGNGASVSMERIYNVGIGTIVQNILDQINLLNKNTYPTLITGKAGSPSPYVRVRWAWLSLPFTLVIAGTALLTWTIVDTSRNRSPLWKGSTLALLFHGLEPDTLRDHEVSEALSQMEILADTISSTLGFSESEGRTVLMNSVSGTTSSVRDFGKAERGTVLASGSEISNGDREGESRRIPRPVP